MYKYPQSCARERRGKKKEKSQVDPARDKTRVARTRGVMSAEGKDVRMNVFTVRDSGCAGYEGGEARL